MERAYKNARERYLGHFEKLPAKVIADVRINTQFASTNEDPKLKDWFDPNYLVEQAAIFATGVNRGSLRFWQAPTMRRGAVLRFAPPYYFDEHGFCYGEINAKGTGLTAYRLSDIVDNITRYLENQASELQLPVSPMTVREKLLFSPEPWGLIGSHGAEEDQEVTNGLAGIRGRTSRVLGLITLHHNALLEWFNEVAPDSEYPLEELLKMVEWNGEQATVGARLLGADRYEDYERTWAKTGVFSHRNIVRRAANVLLAEMDYRGEKEFFQFYGLDNDFPMREHLIKFKNASEIRPILFADPNFILTETYFALWNQWREDILSEKKYNGLLSFHNEDAQNLGLAGFHYDWEETTRGPARQLEHLFPPIWIHHYNSGIGYSPVLYEAEEMIKRAKQRVKED